MTSLRLSVVGGGLSNVHLSRFKKCSDAVQLTGIADCTLETARATAAQYEISRAVTDYLSCWPLSDAVIICVPTHLHAPLAAEALTTAKHYL